MTENERKAAEEVARREVTDFGITVLGYDRDHPGSDPSPREDLQWVRRRRRLEESRQKWAGAIVLTVAGGLIALLLDWAKKKILGL